MAKLLGIDVGTTGAKAVLIDERGEVLAAHTAEYPLTVPRPGWTEQDPESWWQASTASIAAVLRAGRVEPDEVAGVGLTGQMHGLVVLDGGGSVLRPAILWNDQRTGAEAAWITAHVGHERVLELISNPVLTGFTAPKLIWLRCHEPEVYAQIRHILLPKDFLRYRLTGELCTEVSDASGTALFNVRDRHWSHAMLDALEIAAEWLPRCVESPDITGQVTMRAAQATGLRPGIPVVGGAGDQAAQAVGTGIVVQGLVSATIGTSGVVFAYLDAPLVDPQFRTHTFCHAVPKSWHVMGVMLSAGGSLRWLRDALGVADWSREGRDPYEIMTSEASTVAAGCEGLFFLPYLTGERTPYPDPQARGAFVGLTLRHGRPHLVRAVMEGVAYGLRDSLEIIRKIGIDIQEVRVSGGGARSALWRQILADVLATPVSAVNVTEGAAYGAALLAGAGVGVFPNVVAASRTATRVTWTATPDPGRQEVYEQGYAIYRGLYPSLRGAFADDAAFVEKDPPRR